MSGRNQHTLGLVWFAVTNESVENPSAGSGQTSHMDGKRGEAWRLLVKALRPTQFISRRYLPDTPAQVKRGGGSSSPSTTERRLGLVTQQE